MKAGQKPTDPMRIAVLAGGPSAEREISLQSGLAVSEALGARGHSVDLLDPQTGHLPAVDWSAIDVAFLALHGAYGEDGTVQRQLEQLSIPYSGSPAEASAVAFSKSATKERLLAHALPTPAYVLIHETDDAGHIQAQAMMLGYPLVVKPDTQGSSLGVTIVDSPDQLPRALSTAFHYDGYCLLERFVAGSEWTVGLMDDQVLPLIQVHSKSSFYDFSAKYLDGRTEYFFETDESSSTCAEIESVAVRAARTIGTRGLARVDLRLDAYQQPWVLEINTIPGLTDHSLVPKAAARAGLSLGQLCETVCRRILLSDRYSARGA